MNDLGKRLAGGEPAAFAELYDRCADRCHHYLTVFLGSRDAADDVLQETFIRLVRNRSKLDAVDRLDAYVFRIARNEGLRHAQRRARDRQHHTPLTGLDLFISSNEATRRDAAQAVVEALQQLSPELREVVELKIYGGLTFREIGEVAEIPLQTAATRYRCALERLKAWFARQPS
jgi:RNA polymerase sigma-70 factor (ECF subfamily)